MEKFNEGMLPNEKAQESLFKDFLQNVSSGIDKMKFPINSEEFKSQTEKLNNRLLELTYSSWGIHNLQNEGFSEEKDYEGFNFEKLKTYIEVIPSIIEILNIKEEKEYLENLYTFFIYLKDPEFALKVSEYLRKH